MGFVYEPYSVQAGRQETILIGPVPLRRERTYTLMFEDTPIRQYTNRDTVEDICTMLNAAWNVGHATGRMEATHEFECQAESVYEYEK